MVFSSDAYIVDVLEWRRILLFALPLMWCSHFWKATDILWYCCSDAGDADDGILLQYMTDIVHQYWYILIHYSILTFILLMTTWPKSDIHLFLQYTMRAIWHVMMTLIEVMQYEQ